MPLDCTNCPLKDKRDAMSLPLSKNKPYTIVTKPPTPHDVARGNVVPSSYGKILDKELSNSGLRLNKDFNVIPSIRCAYDKDIYTSKEKLLISKTCRVNLADTLARLEPTIIVPLGADATSAVRGKKVKITKVRGVPTLNEEFNTLVLPILDPAIVNIRADNAPLFTSDVQSLVRLIDNDCIVNSSSDFEGYYTLIDDIGFIVDANPEILGLDTETMGFNYHYEDKKLLTIQFCYQEGTAYILSWDHPDSILSDRKKAKVIKDLNTLRKNGVQFTYHNGKFDALWIYKKLGVDLPIHHDALLLYSLINENSYDKNLAVLTKIYVPSMAGYSDAFDLEIDKAHMELVPLNDIVAYGCGDADATLRVTNILLDIVWEDQALWNYYEKVTIPGINAFKEMEKDGIIVDTDKLHEFRGMLSVRVYDLRASLLNRIPRSIRRKHMEKGLNFTRADFLRDILFNHKDGFKFKPQVFTETTKNLPDKKMRLPSTSTKQHLPYFIPHKFVEDLIEFIKLERMLGTNVISFEKKYIHNDGKVWSTFSMSTTVTGRVSSRDPNSQNFPSRGELAKPYKEMFKAPTGCGMVAADYSQMELRIAAHEARDKEMIRIYNSGGDIHAATAASSLGLSLEEFYELPKDDIAKHRFGAKGTNFGYLFSMLSKTYVSYAKTTYGIDVTEKEAEVFRNAYFAKYKQLIPWHKRREKQVHKDKQVRSVFGRVRHLPQVDSDDFFTQLESVRQAINCLSDDTEILTIEGWKTVDNIQIGESVLTVNPITGGLEKDCVQAVHIGNIDQPMHIINAQAISAVATPNHRWLVDTKHHGRSRKTHMKETCDLSRYGVDKIWLSSKGFTTDVSTDWTDNEILLMGWVLTDGHYIRQLSTNKLVDYARNRVGVTQTKPQNIEEIHMIFNEAGKHGHYISKYGQNVWTITNETSRKFRKLMPDRVLTPDVLLSLTHDQRVVLFSTMLRGDGSWDKESGRYRVMSCGTEAKKDMFLMLCALIGQTARAVWRDLSDTRGCYSPKMGNIPIMNGVWQISICVNKFAQPQYNHTIERWEGRVWCPTTSNGTWVARRDNKVFITGNSPVQSAGSDLGVLSLGRITSEIDKRYMYPRFFIHDAIYNYVPSEYMAWGSIALKWYMESNPIQEMFGFEFAVPIVAEPEIGTSQGSLVEVPTPAIALDDITIDDLSYLQDQTADLEKKGLILPPQKIPPNNGRIFRARRQR